MKRTKIVITPRDIYEIPDERKPSKFKWFLAIVLIVLLVLAKIYLF